MTLTRWLFLEFVLNVGKRIALSRFGKGEMFLRHSGCFSYHVHCQPLDVYRARVVHNNVPYYVSLMAHRTLSGQHTQDGQH